MANTRTLAFVVSLVVAVAGLAVQHLAHAASCEAILGKWAWFTKGVMTFNPDGTMVHAPGNDGTWECTDAAQGMVTLRWRQGDYVNQPVLSADGNGLSSTDPSQQFVTARRLGAEAKAPAKQDASAPPPAPAQGGEAFLEGRRLAAAGQCRDAIPYLNQAIQANSRYAKAYSDRGRCFAMLGQLERGLQDLERAVEEVARRVFANIQAQEEQAARDMAARWWWNSTPSSSSSGSSSSGSLSSGGGCSFTSYGACNAEKAGDRWAAERIERGTASGSEKAWYGR